MTKKEREPHPSISIEGCYAQNDVVGAVVSAMLARLSEEIAIGIIADAKKHIAEIATHAAMSTTYKAEAADTFDAIEEWQGITRAERKTPRSA